MELIMKLGKRLGAKKNWEAQGKFTKKILSFEAKSGYLLPPDMAEFFRMLNGAANQMDENLYEFYQIDRFANIQHSLGSWGGIPNYRNIINTFNNYENCYVFADYMMHSFAYAIRLHPDKRTDNQVYIICGDKYKVIANSFTDFLILYFDESIELQFT
jgi:hypothetical protein